MFNHISFNLVKNLDTFIISVYIPLSAVIFVMSNVLLNVLIASNKASFRFISPSLYSCLSMETAFCKYACSGNHKLIHC